MTVKESFNPNNYTRIEILKLKELYKVGCEVKPDMREVLEMIAEDEGQSSLPLDIDIVEQKIDSFLSNHPEIT